MEKSKKIDTNENASGERVKNDTWIPNCPVWIFADHDSADNDLKDAFEIDESAED